MQAVMNIPSIDRTVRVYASRGDDVSPGGTFACKVVKHWPGVISRTNPQPDPHNVYFMHKGVVLMGTVESCTLFFIHKDVQVYTNGPPDTLVDTPSPSHTRNNSLR